ncbi:glycosyltransferase [Jeotgalibacillus soli]|uniref:Glycosyltransferase 2-like domain-containing protein n=1 Tax=Jeotgalibacillus soli TaxID=889306 RepID=A0A0C2VZY0_9BACL|nr:glycosyltransferase [Jeotgalibacillus soli]KIL49931.1 hypothetical protein KP78_13990 [Jeotgalibacillus soli]
MHASVLINNYNYGRFLDDCIESVLQQTYPNIEIVVYDDGSTDESLTVLNKYKDQITIISKPNYGKTPNINQMNAVYQAFLKSSGDIIFLLDSDDIFHHEKIEKAIKIFEGDPNVDTLQHPLIEMNGVGQLADRIIPVFKKVDDYKEYIFSSQNLFHLFVPTSGLVFKREILGELLPLEEDDLSTMYVDTRLMLLSVLKGCIQTIEEPLSYYRIHGSNNSSKIGDVKVHQQYTEELYKYFNKVSTENGGGQIVFNNFRFLESTFFYPLINIIKINAFFGSEETEHERWIWGAGEAGQTVLHSLKHEKHLFKGFIDMDPQKQQAIVMDKKVNHPEDILLLKNTKILVSPYHAYKEISGYLRSIGLVEGLNFISPYRD